MKNSIIGLKELRENIGAYIKGVEQGREFIVVKKSKPIFRIAPLEKQNMVAIDLDGEWETVIDFTRVHKGGVSIQELLSRL